MSTIELNQTNRATLVDVLSCDGWVIACLCAAWCDTCRSYRTQFDAVASQHLDKTFVWIDIEEQSDLISDIDVDNFPTLLLQRGDTVGFFGTVLPDQRLTERLIQSYADQSSAELHASATRNPAHQQWQSECNLRSLIAQANIGH